MYPRPLDHPYLLGNQDVNLVEWKEKMDDYLGHAGYTMDEDKLRMLRMYLKDRAKIW